MTTKTLAAALTKKKPAIIRERGEPRFVVLDWDTYRSWEEWLEDADILSKATEDADISNEVRNVSRRRSKATEDLEDAERLEAALVNPKNQKRIPFARVKKLLDLP